MYAPGKAELAQAPCPKACFNIEKMITIATNPGDIVFDPFMGVGSSGAAALALGRKYIGFEIDRSYFDAAYNRLNENDYTTRNTI